MVEQIAVDRLAALFEETGKAHHQAYIATNGEDPEWPLWYADYLVERITDLLGKKLTRSEISHWLLLADAAASKSSESGGWTEKYAAFFFRTRNDPRQ